MPQSSTLTPILFNIFLNDLFLWLKNWDLHNFADDNTMVVTCNNLTSLYQTLEKESEKSRLKRYEKSRLKQIFLFADHD